MRYSPSIPTAALLVAAVPLATLLLAGCQGGGDAGSTPRRADRPRETILRPTEDPQLAPYRDRFARVEQLIVRWDTLRNDGRPGDADAVAAQIRTEVDAAFPDFERASRGELKAHAQYLAVSALGFSANPRATQLLLAQVQSSGDAQLLGNALIALSVRADPQTPGTVLLGRIAPNQGIEVRRYAPLALANVLEARRRAGLPVDARFEREALARLRPLAVEQDPVVRLHVAKALGTLRIPDAVEPLGVLARDPQMRVRWSAAAGLERSGDPRGFPDVVRLLHEVAEDSKHIVRDILVTYAGKLQGRPLTPAEIARLGTGARAWSQWFNELQKSGRMKSTTARATRRQ